MTLKLDDNNENVKKLHTMLKDLQYPVKNMGEVFDDNTRESSKSFSK
ncbi:MAG: hypothetical protein FWC79_00195 [Oscillospiraceae bacterium]|nr:hypothetical protein [Oscillospiraceae bacterium]